MRSAVTAVVAALVALLTSGTALAQSTITLAPALGHPLLPVTVSGAGFGNGEAVDVFVDTVDTVLLVSSATGTLSGPVTIPASAQPGAHFITAIGRRSGNAAQATFKVTTPWLEFGFGSARQGFNPYENTVNTSNVWSLGTLWSYAGSGSGAAPAVASGRVIVTGNPGIRALSATTGSVVWNKIPTENFGASPTVIANVVYVGSTFGNFYALNASNGATNWSKALGSSMYSSAAVVGNVVYVGAFNGNVYALQASTGATIWTATTGSVVVSSPAVANGIVYIGSDDSKLYALNAATGAVLWTFTAGGEVESSPVVSNGIVYFGSDDSKVYAIRAAGPNGGRLIWSSTTGGPVYGAPAVAYGSVFAGSADGKIYAFNARSGALQWSTATTQIVSTPAIANGVVYATSRDDSLNAYSATSGALLYTSYSGYSFFGSPTISDGVLYVDGDDDNVSAYSLLASTSGIRVPLSAPALSSLHPDFSLTATPYRKAGTTLQTVIDSD